MIHRWIACAVATLLLLGVARAAIEVSMPSEGLQVVAGRPFTVEWAGENDERKTDVDLHVQIDLHYCGDDCDNPDLCGEWVTALCNYALGGCSLNGATGEYDVTMPEPFNDYGDGHDGGQYKVSVTLAGDTSCSAAFNLVPSTEEPQSGDFDGPFLEVISPMENDAAVAGEDYTVEFAYDNGLGSSVDRFKIDLYLAGVGDGDCGEWATSICDKPAVGCKDSTGDYDVTIPATTVPGEYRIRVGRFADDSLFGCSGKFQIENAELSAAGDSWGGDGGGLEGDDDWGGWGVSFSFTFSIEDDDNFSGSPGGEGSGGGVGGGVWPAPEDDDDVPAEGSGGGGGGGGGGGSSGDASDDGDGGDDDGLWKAPEDDDVPADGGGGKRPGGGDEHPGDGDKRPGGGLWGDDDLDDDGDLEESIHGSFSFSYVMVWELDEFYY